ncbi:MAG: hypothetical protein ACI9K5_002792 [Gammaproteobacteria bacterium]|jgi:hypothetical protein
MPGLTTEISLLFSGVDYGAPAPFSTRSRCTHFEASEVTEVIQSGSYSLGTEGFSLGGTLLSILPDGTYEYTVWGCLGVYKEVRGGWSQEGSTLWFSRAIGGGATRAAFIRRTGGLVAVHVPFDGRYCSILVLDK